MEPAPVDHCHPAGYLDVSPHTGQLIYMVVTAGKDVLHKHSAPSPAGQGGHEDSLGIGGEARVRGGAHWADSPQRAVAGQTDLPRPGLHPAARLLECAEHRCQVVRVHSRGHDLAPRGSYCAQIGRSGNSVSDYGMFRGVEGQSALYGDDRRPRPLHLCTHGPQELLKVYDLRLLGGPHQSGPARTATGGQQDVLAGSRHSMLAVVVNGALVLFPVHTGHDGQGSAL